MQTWNYGWPIIGRWTRLGKEPRVKRYDEPWRPVSIFRKYKDWSLWSMSFAALALAAAVFTAPVRKLMVINRLLNSFVHFRFYVTEAYKLSGRGWFRRPCTKFSLGIRWCKFQVPSYCSCGDIRVRIWWWMNIGGLLYKLATVGRDRVLLYIKAVHK